MSTFKEKGQRKGKPALYKKRAVSLENNEDGDENVDIDVNIDVNVDEDERVNVDVDVNVNKPGRRTEPKENEED